MAVRGMQGFPDVSKAPYRGMARPMAAAELKQDGWMKTGYGHPAYVRLAKIGACQVIGVNGSWTAIALCGIETHGVVDIATLAHPMVPTPRWVHPWKVRSSLVEYRTEVIKAATATPDGAMTPHAAVANKSPNDPTLAVISIHSARPGDIRSVGPDHRLWSVYREFERDNGDRMAHGIKIKAVLSPTPASSPWSNVPPGTAVYT